MCSHHRLDKVCTQIPGKSSYPFYLATLGATYIHHSSTRHVHNLMKSQLYTYLCSEGCLVLLLSVAGLCAHFEGKKNYRRCTLVAL